MENNNKKANDPEIINAPRSLGRSFLQPILSYFGYSSTNSTKSQTPQYNHKTKVADLFKDVKTSIRDEFGWTSLMHAAYQGKIERVKLLLVKGADVNAENRDGYTALTLAAGHDSEYSIEVAKVLLAKGADKNARDVAGCTALILAAEKGNIEIVKLLLAKGADVEASDILGYTALMRAAQHGNIEIVKLLLEKGANPNAEHISGLTPITIMFAHPTEHILEIATLLLENGADVYTPRTQLNINALDLARIDCRMPEKDALINLLDNATTRQKLAPAIGNHTAQVLASKTVAKNGGMER